MKILTTAGLALWGASVVPGSEIARVFGNGRIQRSDRTARVTTAAEIAAVNRGETTNAVDFAVQAHVLRIGPKETTDSLVVQDESGASSVRLPFKSRPEGLASGCRIALSGVITYRANKDPTIIATNCIILAHGPPRQPCDVTIGEIHSGRLDFQLVRVTAVVHDAFRDEIDKGYTFLVLLQEGQMLYAAIPNSYLPETDLSGLVGATVSISGISDVYCGITRRYNGRRINLYAKSDLVVIKKSTRDIFNEPDIETLRHVAPDRLHTFGRRTARGRVEAVWSKSSILIKRADGEFTTVLSVDSNLPGIGETIVASGFPETDLYTITLTRSVWKKISDAAPVKEKPIFIAAGNLVSKNGTNEIFMPKYHGKRVRLEGLVRTLPGIGNETRLQLDCNGTIFPVDIGANPSASEGLAIGCRVAITGVCVLDIERLRPNALFPRIRGFTIVMQPEDAFEILSRPSWWTPARAWSVFGGFSALLLAAIAWIVTLQRVVVRYARSLMKGQIESVRTKLQVEERTRLASDLHDLLSQTLTGVSMEIAAAKDLMADPTRLDTHLTRADRALKSCRDELKYCLWDLCSAALDEPDMTKAVIRTLQPQIDGKRLCVLFNVPRSRLSDKTAHTILRVIRELVINALRHGKATRIRVAGALDDDALRFSVSDNGCGFDPDSRPGILQGHFGLQSIEDRLRMMGGRMSIESAPGRGARIRCFIARKSQAPQKD